MKYYALACILGLAACGGGRAAPQRYGLNAEPLPLACHSGASIKLYEPNAAPGLDSYRITVIDRPLHHTHYQGVAWNASAPRMVLAFLADMFEQSGMFTAVATDDDSIKTPWIVETRLHALQVEQNNATLTAVTELTATLLRSSDRRPVRSLRLARRSDVSGRDMAAIIGVFNRQLGAIGEEMLREFSASLGCRQTGAARQ